MSNINLFVCYLFFWFVTLKYQAHFLMQIKSRCLSYTLKLNFSQLCDSCCHIYKYEQIIVIITGHKSGKTSKYIYTCVNISVTMK